MGKIVGLDGNELTSEAKIPVGEVRYIQDLLQKNLVWDKEDLIEAAMISLNHIISVSLNIPNVMAKHLSKANVGQVERDLHMPLATAMEATANSLERVRGALMFILDQRSLATGTIAGDSSRIAGDSVDETDNPSDIVDDGEDKPKMVE